MSDKKTKTSLRDINQPLYRYWEAIYLSFYSADVYRDVRLRWKGINAIYLFLVILVFCLPLALKVSNSMLNYFDNKIIQPLEKLPSLYIQNGSVSIDKPMPYFVKNNDGDVIAAIDTTGEIDSFSKDYPEMTILVTKNAINYRYLTPSNFLGLENQKSSPPKIVKQDLESSENIVLNMKQAINQSGVKKIRFAIQFLIYPILVFSVFSAYMVLMLSFALLGEVIAKTIFKIDLKYKASCRISTLALTPHLAFSLVLAALGFYIPAYGFFAMLILISYYCFGLISVKKDMKQLVY